MTPVVTILFGLVLVTVGALGYCAAIYVTALFEVDE